MAGQLREIRRRIRSVQSTKKITRAMELIAASRIARAQARVEAARPYSEQITEVIRNLQSAGAGGDQPLLRTPETISKVGHVVITSDRGLAGGYNSNVLRAAETAIKEDIAAGRGYMLVTVGRKALAYFRYRRYTIHASYQGMSDLPTYEDAREVAGEVMRAFEAGQSSGEGVDVVKVSYTRFLSLGTQRPTVSQLMPLEAIETGAGADSGEEGAGPSAAYIYEPEPDAILETLLPRYVEARMFAHMLDASASEHAARQRAMKSATDNADDLIKTLSRIANRARQDEITTEIMEIVGGAEALRQAADAN
ncbi:MAG TPA: F0F1 ATP synthase subunit gamma [Acidimicrobiia bacterium]|nr:F0F1 ATP synthase subunit gamma [Acidimicrobiia bacterium]